MNPRVKKVKPNADYTITLWFTNGQVRRFDVKPYLDKGIFRELQEPHTFNTVKPFLGSVQWKDGQDFCPDTLYEESELVVASTDRPKTHKRATRTTPKSQSPSRRIVSE